MIIICLKYTSLIKTIETTTLARWSGIHLLRTVWQSIDRGKYKIVFKNKFCHWANFILNLVVSQSFWNLKETVCMHPFHRSHHDHRCHQGTSPLLLWHNPANVQLVTHPCEQRSCWEATRWSAGTLRTPGHLSKMTLIIQPNHVHHRFAVEKILNVLLF